MPLLMLPMAMVVGWWIRLALWRRRSSMEPVSQEMRNELAGAYDASTLDALRVVVGRPPVPGIVHVVKLFAPSRVVTEPSGITFGNCVIVQPGLENDVGLMHHELVHVVQWREIGWTRFLLVYIVGVVRHGYLGCPLEEVAYRLTAAYDWQGGRFDEAEPMERRSVETETIRHAREQVAKLQTTRTGRMAWWLARG